MPRVPHKSSKYTHFPNEITGSYHNERTDWVAIGIVIFMVVACAVILLKYLEAEALMYGV